MIIWKWYYADQQKLIYSRKSIKNLFCYELSHDYGSFDIRISLSMTIGEGLLLKAGDEFG